MLHQFSILFHGTRSGKWSVQRRRDAGQSADAGGGSAAAPPSSQGGSPTSSTPPESATGTPITPDPTSQSVNQGGDPQDRNFAALRTKHDAAAARLGKIDGLGFKDEQLTSITTQYKGWQTEATTLAKELGYDDEADVAEAFAADPIKTLQLLREEKATAEREATSDRKPGESDADFSKRIQEMVRKQLDPVTKHINQQITDSVMAKVDTTFDTAFKAVLPNAPAPVRELIDDYVSESLTHSPELIAAMRNNGDFSGVTKMVETIGKRMQSVFTEWVKAERTRTGGRDQVTTTAADGTTRRPTLDDMINDPGIINPKYR